MSSNKTIIAIPIGIICLVMGYWIAVCAHYWKRDVPKEQSVKKREFKFNVVDALKDTVNVSIGAPAGSPPYRRCGQIIPNGGKATISTKKVYP